MQWIFGDVTVALKGYCSADADVPTLKACTQHVWTELSSSSRTPAALEEARLLVLRTN